MKRICVIFAPDVIGMATTTMDSTIKLFEPLSEILYAISANLPDNLSYGNNVRIINIKMNELNKVESSIFIKAPRFIMMQLRMCQELFKIRNRIDIVIMAAGSSTFPLLPLTAKMLHKKVISLRSGTNVVHIVANITYSKTLFGLGHHIFVPIVDILERLNYLLSDKIIIFRSNFNHKALKRYKDKIILGTSRFYIDTEKFSIIKDLDSREYSVGFVGRFIDTGGSLNFTKSLPLVFKEMPNIRAIIVGEGDLHGEIDKIISDNHLENKVTLSGWINHTDIPRYLNNIKLAVIPSYEEEGSHLLFEATACGTIVLGTPSGMIPEVVNDGITGFLMKDNSPECIAQNIIRALKTENLNDISKNTRRLIEQEYTYEAAVKKYERILSSL